MIVIRHCQHTRESDDGLYKRAACLTKCTDHSLELVYVEAEEGWGQGASLFDPYHARDLRRLVGADLDPTHHPLI